MFFKVYDPFKMKVIKVKVKPGSSKECLFYDENAKVWIVRVKAKAINGKANQALIKVLKQKFLNPRIKKGFSRKNKLVVVDGER